MRRACRTRFWLRRVARRSTLLALVSLSGQRHSQEAKWCAFLKALKSLPNSLISVMAVARLTPGMAVRSTPKMRQSSSCQGPLGSFLEARLGRA